MIGAAVDVALPTILAVFAGLLAAIWRSERGSLASPMPPPPKATDPEVIHWSPMLAGWVAFLALLVLLLAPVVFFGGVMPALVFLTIVRRDRLARRIRGMSSTELRWVKWGMAAGIIAGLALLAGSFVA
jgi:hypothetical protein